MKKDFIVYAHRGASEYAPENTLQSFYLGVQMGANGIETDVQKTKDGVLILFHDDTLERVTGAKGKVCDYTFDQLANLLVKRGDKSDKIITLEEFLIKFGWKDLTFAIELKSSGVAKESIDLIKKYKVENKCIITSFNFQNLKEAFDYAPRLRIGYLVQKIDSEVLEQIKEIKLTEICPCVDIIDKDFVKEWNDKGYDVRAWGIANENLMKYAYECGVCGMTVNFPDKLVEYISRRSK